MAESTSPDEINAVAVCTLCGVRQADNDEMMCESCNPHDTHNDIPTSRLKGVPKTTQIDDNPVVNELLCYSQFHLKITIKKNIIEAVGRHFSLDEVVAAKDCLCGVFSNQPTLKLKLKNRRNTTNKMKADSIIEDIINAMIDIDQKGGTTNFVARNIDRLPRCDPKDIDPYANLQRLLVMEEKMTIVEEKLNASQADVVYCRVEVDIMKQTVQSHEAVVKNRSPVAPSYADVSEAGCDQNDDENTLVKQMM